MGILSSQNMKKQRLLDRKRTKDFSFFENNDLIKELDKKLQLHSVRDAILTRIVLSMGEEVGMI
jgi:hypothetical protein